MSLNIISIGVCRLRWNNEAFISVPLMAEMVLCGASLSIGLAVALEGTAQSQARDIWLKRKRESENPNDSLSISTFAAFTILVLISVALMEEFAKAMPLSRFKTRRAALPHRACWWFRFLPTPKTLVLAGTACGAGFAVVENIKYVWTIGNDFSKYKQPLKHGMQTAWARAFTAIPFHIACTGYSAAVFAKHLFRRTEMNRKDGNPGRGDGNPVPGGESKSKRSNVESAIAPFEEMAASLIAAAHEWPSTPLPPQLASIWKFLSMMKVPIFLHALYDTGLFAATRFFRIRAKTAAASRSLASVTSSMYDFTHLSSHYISPLYQSIPPQSFPPTPLITTIPHTYLPPQHDNLGLAPSSLSAAMRITNYAGPLGLCSVLVAFGSLIAMVSLFWLQFDALAEEMPDLPNRKGTSISALCGGCTDTNCHGRGEEPYDPEQCEGCLI